MLIFWKIAGRRENDRSAEERIKRLNDRKADLDRRLRALGIFVETTQDHRR